MNKKARGKRSKTRAKLKKKKGKATVNQALRQLPKGTKVQIDIRPEAHSGMPPAIYQGSSGTVEGKQGEAFKVRVKKGTATKELVVGGIHLKQEGVFRK